MAVRPDLIEKEETGHIEDMKTPNTEVKGGRVVDCGAKCEVEQRHQGKHRVTLSLGTAKKLDFGNGLFNG